MTALKLAKQIESPTAQAIRENKLNNWVNPDSGWGVNTRADNTAFFQSTFVQNSEAESLYRTDWAAGKTIDIPIGDMFKKELDFMEDQEESANIEPLLEEMDRLDWRAKFIEATTEAHKQGGALAVITFQDSGDYRDPLVESTVKGITRIDVIQKWYAQPVTYYDDPTEENFGQPMHYLVSFIYPRVTFQTEVHESRVIRFDSPKQTAMLAKAENNSWNDSRFTEIYAALKKFGMAQESGGDTLQNFILNIFKAKDVNEKSLTEAGRAVLQRMANLFKKHNTNKVAIIGEGEEMERQGTPLTGFTELVSIYGDFFYAAAKVPKSKFLGVSEGGALNGGTKKGEDEDYHDWIISMQKGQLKPQIMRLFEFISYYQSFDLSKVDFQFMPLFELSETEQAALYKTVSEADGINIQNQVMTPEDVAKNGYLGKKIDFTTRQLDKSEIDEQAEIRELEAEKAEEMMMQDQEQKKVGDGK